MIAAATIRMDCQDGGNMSNAMDDKNPILPQANIKLLGVALGVGRFNKNPRKKDECVAMKSHIL